MDSHYEGSSLLRSEISTLIGLMARNPWTTDMPTPEALQGYIDRTDGLMQELHHAMAAEAFFGGRDLAGLLAGRDPFQDGAAMREPIFYGGESAYNFQYKALTELKYRADQGWLERTRGFNIAEALLVAKAIGEFHLHRLTMLRKEMRALSPDLWTFLPASTFTIENIAARSEIEPGKVAAIFAAFKFDSHDRNAAFTGLSEFNETNARPILA